LLVCDTSGLIAYFDSSDRHHARVMTTIEADEGPFVISPYVLAEVDYLIATRHGVQAELVVLEELSGGAWDLACCDREELRVARGLVERYSDQQIGVTDASLVVLASRFRTDRLLTLDHRHFGVVRTINGRPFKLLPR